ncbi:hypothetical protein RRG08_060446 [Elysia crispata]|uniref:Uncharacterized protein n=1 Tax=Elysia crispata TaxID=231223 RepID=A0AAE1DU03_9GAST|nr:hypothetical protein RRG08_060446 [Elysia crispata]
MIQRAIKDDSKDTWHPQRAVKPVPSTSFTMKTLLIVCLGAITLVANSHSRTWPACKFGGFNDCVRLYYIYKGVGYCCEDTRFRPVLSGLPGTASFSCICLTKDDYCVLYPAYCD